MKIKIVLCGIILCVSTISAQITTEALLDTIQHTAFNFFWNEANPANGLIRDRQNVSAPKDVPSSIASVGFGLTAIAIGVDHGWVSREAARDRVLITMKTFWNAPQGSGNGYAGKYGLFYHFLDMNTARRAWDSELSTIDTALLLAGIIDMKQYFTGSDSLETLIRNYSDSIYYRMNWDLMRNFNPGIMLGWMPNTGFANYGQWVGYNEASLMYIFAMGSPTYPVDYMGWQKWTEGYNSNYKNQYGYLYVNFAPLFGHQYSHCWIDFRNIADDWMKEHNLNYFENSRRATLAQRAYSIANPKGHTGYSDSLWGITASDVPSGYAAHGAPPPENDDGTIVPTAPISSIPFAPDEVMPVIKNMWNNYHSQLWTKYGFRDAFNLNVNWWGQDVIGIDQGPIIIMIENYRNQSVWKRFMKNADVQRGLATAKFTTITGVATVPQVPAEYGLSQNYPNPFNPSTRITYQLPKESFVTVKVFDLLGSEIVTLVNKRQLPGIYNVSFRPDAFSLPSGVYFYSLTTESISLTRKMVLVK
ncbi:MAG: T9SS type A sorting domain-containing protein [Bacteroidetes bacterium]|nr:T9SS type A sorting domain-containing protein [Bacteroidota bacterium]